MASRKKVFIIVLILLTGFIAGILIVKQDTNQKNTPPLSEEQQIRDLNEDYTFQMKSLITEYDQIKDSQDASKIVGLRARMVALKVPSEHRPFHLEMIIGLDLIEQGLQDNDTFKIENGKNKIADALQSNEWAQ